MRRSRHFGSALVMSALVASGMFTFSARLHAQAAKDTSGSASCTLLDFAENAANALPDGPFKTAVLASIDAQQEALGCDSVAE
jgi:hypothetical protein